MEKIKDCLKKIRKKAKMFIAKIMWRLFENWFATCEWCLVSAENYMFVQTTDKGWWFKRKSKNE